MRKKLRDKETYRKTSGLFEKKCVEMCVKKRKIDDESRNLECVEKRDGEIKTRVSCIFTRNIIEINLKNIMSCKEILMKIYRKYSLFEYINYCIIYYYSFCLFILIK